MKNRKAVNEVEMSNNDIQITGSEKLCHFRKA
jgi:hypothetical protein